MDLEGTLQRALALINSGDLPAAESHFLALLRAFPGEPNACNFLGLLRRRQGRIREAETLIRQAIEAYPDAGSFHNNLANVLADQGRTDEAMDAYRSALRHEPELLDARFNLANLCLLAGNRPEALELTVAALAQAPEDLGILRLYGSVLGIGNPPFPGPCPSGPVSPWLGNPFAFLAEPDWRGQGWKDLVEDFALSFAIWEPVSLILLLDPAKPGCPGVAEAESLIRATLTATGLATVSPVLAVPLGPHLPTVLSGYSRAQWLHQDPLVLSGVEGQLGVRLAARRYARALEVRPGPPFMEALRGQILQPAQGPPWAAAPLGTTFLLEASWPETYLRHVLAAFLAAFGPGDPSACLLLHEPGRDAPSWLDEYRDPPRGQDLSARARIHLVAEFEGWLEHLRRFPKLLRVPGPPGPPAGLEGRMGERFADSLHKQFQAGIPDLHPVSVAAPRPGRKWKVLCFTSDAARHATFQLRIGGPAWAHAEHVDLQAGLSLADRGKDSFSLRSLQEADLILIQRFFPRNETRALLEAIFASGKPVLMETDDLVHCIPESNPNFPLSTLARDFLLDAMARSTSLIVSTPALGDELVAINPRVEVMPNLLDPRLWGPALDQEPASREPVTIGYCGTPTHLEDLGVAEEALVRISEKHRSGVAFHFFGCVTPRLERLPGTMVTAFQDGYGSYARTLMEGGLQIAVAPLVDHRFNRCKSHIKWLEYSALGAAGVYSDLEPYRTAVRSGDTGLLAPGDPHSWFLALDHLVCDHQARRQMAQRARQDVLDHHMLGPSSPWLGILERAIARRQS